MEEMALLRFLKQNRGASVYEVMKEFGIKRTAALYHLDELLNKSLIVIYKKGRSNLFLVAETEKVQEYFEKKKFLSYRKVFNNLQQTENIRSLKRGHLES